MKRAAMKTEFEIELDRQVDERIGLMQQEDYVFPRSLSRIDWVLIVAIPVISLVLLAVGPAL